MMTRTETYSKARWLLTQAIREIETVLDNQQIEPLDSTAASELEYYLSTLFLIRNSLYGCEDTYKGSLNLEECTSELKKDASAFYSMTRGELTEKQHDCIHTCYVVLHKVGKIAQCLK